MVSVVVAYLAGSVLFGVLVARGFGVDIYRQGSGNPGTSNVMRAVGARAAAAVLVGDVVKGLTAAALGDAWAGGDVGLVCIFAAAVGHAYPLFHRFRGGKGVAVAGGGFIWLAPLTGAVLLAGWIAIVVTTRTASLASMAVALVLVPAMAVAGFEGSELLWVGAVAAFILYRHTPNIRRLLRGREQRLRER